MPWYFGVAFAFCFKYCTGMPGMDGLPLAKRMKRHTMRILSDSYGKGVVRSQAESCNLRLYSDELDVVAAEAIRTTVFSFMPGQNLVDMFERVRNMEGVEETRSTMLKTNRYGHRKQRLSLKNQARYYDLRPSAREGSPDLWFLSAYEFFMYWRIEKPTYVKHIDELKYDIDNDRFHAFLTVTGVDKLSKVGVDICQNMVSGEDYIVKKNGTSLWHPFTDTAETSPLRNKFVFIKNIRPRCPKFISCPLPTRGMSCEQTAERSASIILAYFHPFTLRRDMETKHVPTPDTMLTQSESSWSKFMVRWFGGGTLDGGICEVRETFFKRCSMQTQSSRGISRKF